MTWTKKTQSQPSRSEFGHAVDELAALGLTLPPKPAASGEDAGIPLLPDDLGDLSPEGLMDLFNRLTQWAGYIAVQLVKLEVQEDDLEARLKVQESMYIVTNVERGAAGLQRAQRERDVDEEIIKLREAVRLRHVRVKLTRTLFDNTERSAALLSRELSRRIGSAPAQGRLSWMKP